jgi:D-aminopeptidase
MRYFLLLLLLSSSDVFAQAQKSRARALGVPFNGTPGQLNAITDVKGVLVGYKTKIEGSGKLNIGKGPVRTGVTVVLPKGKTGEGYAAAWFSINGDGELTGTTYVNDFGTGYGPIGITNTNSVGIVRDAIGVWSFNHFSKGEFVDYSFGLPVVGETWDGAMNDINGFHVKQQDVFSALDSAHNGIVQEGNVGGGTGMWLYGFKGGTGTASRIITIDSVQYTVGVLLQANFGNREDLTVAGVPVGKEITDLQPVFDETKRKDGSCIIIIATDAPLSAIYLQLLARRATHGIARTGSYSSNGSGEIVFAFSTQSPSFNKNHTQETASSITKWSLDPLLKATVEATEEAIINVLCAAETMQGIDGNTLYALPHKRLQEILKKYNRLNKVQ